MFGLGRANRVINYSYGYAELLTQRHVKRNQLKVVSFPTTKLVIYFFGI